MDADQLETELTQYEVQLQQVCLAISASSEGEEKEHLISLKNDVQELINLTKESIVKSQNNIGKVLGNNGATQDSLDHEYSLFKAELAELETETSTIEETSGENIDLAVKELEGSKCQAPFKNGWNGVESYHNALIFQVDCDSSTNCEEIRVRVMFTHPSSNQMLPCPYYLDGSCRFTDEKCKFSHGELVLINQLKEYRDPNFSNIKTGSVVLAKHVDNLWHRAVVISVDEEEYLLKLESSKQEIKNNLKDIFPLDDCGVDSDSEDSSDIEEIEQNVVTDDEGIGRILLAPPSSALGEWEKHTKGFGSRIMAKMGYITGAGLGVRSDGRVEPVPAVVLPPGKSLDHCMMLRENAGGDENLFKSERKMKRQQLKYENALKKHKEKEENKTDVFTFINSKLGMQLAKSKQQKNKCLKEETCHGLNITSLQLSEEIRRTEKDIQTLRQSLNRQSVDTPAYTCIQEKLNNRQDDLKRLQLSESRITTEQEQRKDKKKLSVF